MNQNQNQDQNSSQNKNLNNQTPKHKFDIAFIVMLLIGIVGVFMIIQFLSVKNPEKLTYNEFVEYVETDKISGDLKATPVGGENYLMYTISGTYLNADGKSEKFTLIVNNDLLNNIMQTDAFNKVNIKLVAKESDVWLSLFVSFAPFLIIGILFYIFFRKLLKSQATGGGATDFAKSTARLSRGKTVTFKDVAGCDEEKQEMVEIVDFLKNPRKYNEIGARVPKGVILFGPPGTGKTLLAKAVAGEAGVPFFSISGSDFVEMFVGVGAARVRDMFKTAKENAPCIIFIDEIDAVGRQRGAGMGGGHDEREQTLNQLLVEMDGFVPNSGIIIMAATNRPDVLDPALLRPGRFDRQITISNPDVKGREAILEVHARNKHLAPGVKLSDLAQRTPGFSGADIENLLNEAALLAARENRKLISMSDLDEAIDRVMMGPAKKSRKYIERERKLVAIHEAGHAVIGLRLKNASVVQKITIVPRGDAGGYNLMMPKEETYFHTKSQLIEQIIGLFGGRVAEEIVFNEVTTGAHNDFQKATAIARAMVTEYGMSSLGPVQYEAPNGSVFLGRDYLKEKNFSDQVALEIDKETRKILEECYEMCKKCITENIELLHKIADYLLKIETLTKADIDEIEATGSLKWYEDKMNPSQETNEESPQNEESSIENNDEPLENKDEEIKKEANEDSNNEDEENNN